MKQIKKKNKTMRQVEERLGGEIEDILRVKYVDENLPIGQITEELGISYATTIHWLKLAGIWSRRLKVDTE